MNGRASTFIQKERKKKPMQQGGSKFFFGGFPKDGGEKAVSTGRGPTMHSKEYECFRSRLCF